MGGIAANQSSDTSKAYQLAVLVLLQSNGPEQGGVAPSLAQMQASKPMVTAKALTLRME